MRISDWSSDVCSSDLPSCTRRCGAAPLASSPRITKQPALPRESLWWSSARRRQRRRGPASTSTPRCATLSATPEIGRAHVCTPVTNAHIVCRLLLEYIKYPTLHDDDLQLPVVQHTEHL